ncbi:MAG: hypothetical protein HY897_05855 [Deltaproteobacteria bacterium]|nr:hypothetical protein [Deltaproteobacteria bacterium]
MRCRLETSTYFTETDPGEVRFETGGQDRYAAVAERFAEVSNDRIRLLVEAAEWPEEIDTERAAKDRTACEQKLGAMTLYDPEYGFRELRLKRALNRLAVAKRASSKT